ncbi:MAG: hypothetical protein OEV08_13090, partial [Nitrospira sp.]|nr:hypothetical protein [Nitrospira sp.]
HASPVAQAVVKKILALPSGPFTNKEFLTSQVGTKFLSYLAEADPSGTLGVLEQTFATWSRDDLQKWTTGRQDIVWTLEKLVVWKDLFQRAATVLCRLALAENAKNSNNSKGLFTSLFSIGIGWAPTEAPPDLRYPILETLVRSKDPAERNLGLELCGEWLSTRGGMRIIGAEYQGLRPPIQFWRPLTYGEMFDAWRKVWRFLDEELKKRPVADRKAVASTMVDSGADLIHWAAVGNEVMATLFRLAGDPATDKAHLIKVVIRELRHRYSKLPKGILARLKELDKELTGTSFNDRFGRFVLHTTWDEDHTFKGEKVEEDQKTITKVEELAREVVKDPALFSAELLMFVTSEGHRLVQFGFEVSKQKVGAEWDDQIFSALKSASNKATSEFVSGYLSYVRERDLARWEKLILKLLGDSDLRTVGVNAVFRSGVSEAVVRQLLTQYRSELITCRVFSHLGYSARKAGVEAPLMSEVIEALLTRDDKGALGVAVELMNQYYCGDEAPAPLPRALTYRVIEAGISEKEDRDGMREYYWHQIANRYRKQYPDHDMELFAVMLKHFDRLSRIRSNNHASQVADDIVRKHPKDAWKLIAQALEGDKKHAYEIVSWLGEMGFEDSPKAGALRLLDPQDIINWTKDDPDKRVSLMYHALPRNLDQDDGGTITRLFIETFSDLDRVRPALISHFMYGGGWSGPRSEYLARKRDKARKWLSEATSSKVQVWLTQYIEALSADIESAQIGEERDF